MSSSRWWECDVCLIGKEVCVDHAAVLHGSGAGRDLLRKELRETEQRASRLQLALARIDAPPRRRRDELGEDDDDDFVDDDDYDYEYEEEDYYDDDDDVDEEEGKRTKKVSPTLLLKRSGWSDDLIKTRFKHGVLPIALAVKALGAETRAAVCKALRGAQLHLSHCKDACFWVDLWPSKSLPANLLDRLPYRPERTQLRPGAVLLTKLKDDVNDRTRLIIYSRVCKMHEQADSKLFGYVLRGGLDGLAYRHVPNELSKNTCDLCWRGGYCSMDLRGVAFDGDDGPSEHDYDGPWSDEDSDDDGEEEEEAVWEDVPADIPESSDEDDEYLYLFGI